MKPIYFTMALLMGSLMATAQEYPANEGNPDTPVGPGRGIARISVINGDVSVRRGDSGDVTAAALNAPLLGGDTLLTGNAARAELQFDSANMARIAAASEVRMGDLQYHHNQIQVALGLVTFTVVRNSEAESEIDTPNVAVHPKGRGAFRILVRDDGTTEITVRAGEADVTSTKGSQPLRAGQTMMVRGTQDDPEFQVVAAVQEDDWDRWNVDRDRELARATSTRYVNPDIYGAEDLDPYGHWVNDGSYGMVWTPTVSADWAPYRAGRWVWGDDYGWTWVSSDPWGWAPYHYGRWYHASFGWAWWPGAYRGPCYWSPALVGFFGFGGGGGFGFGFGNVGWVPLAPYERFNPWWGRGYYGGRNTVIVNNINIYNTYHNARYNGAVTAVGAGEFGRSSGRFAAVNGAEIRNAGLVRGGLPVMPDRSSLRLSDRAVNMSNFRQSGNTQFFSRGGSSQVRTVPFDQQRQAMQRSGFAGSQQSGVGASRGGNFNAPMTGAPNSAPAQGGGAHGWGRFGEPIHSSGTAQTAPGAQFAGRGSSSTAPQSGWGRFSGGNSAPRSEAIQQPYGRQYGRQGGSSPDYGRGNAGGDPVRISPPIVRERPSVSEAPGAYSGSNSGGRFGGGRSQTYSAPSYSAPAPAPSYSAPRGYSQPSYSAPRSDPGYGGGRSFGRAPSYSAPAPTPSYSAPRGYSQPSYSAPRSDPGYGGGRSFGRAPSYSAPAPSYSAPRSAPSYGGGGRAPSYSAPRSQPSGGGGGGRAPDNSGGRHR